MDNDELMFKQLEQILNNDSLSKEQMTMDQTDMKHTPVSLIGKTGMPGNMGTTGLASLTKSVTNVQQQTPKQPIKQTPIKSMLIEQQKHDDTQASLIDLPVRKLTQNVKSSTETITDIINYPALEPIKQSDTKKKDNVSGKDLAKYIISKYVSTSNLSLEQNIINEIESNILVISKQHECPKASFIKNKYLKNSEVLSKLFGELSKELLKFSDSKISDKLKKKKSELALFNIISVLGQQLLHISTNQEVFADYIKYMNDITIHTLRNDIKSLKK
jgi:hypothetical protein